MNFIDISPLLNSKLAVFPGDQSFSRSVSMDINNQDNITLSAITTTLHAGAHVDAPSHYAKNTQAIHERELHYYIGGCQVIEPKQRPTNENRLELKHFDAKDLDNIYQPRILVKTNSFPDTSKWNSDFWSFHPDFISYLHTEKKVKLMGIDTPSIDPEQSKDLPSHQKIAAYNMAILEGIDLSSVNCGEYTLIALPLKIEQGDASPVRAILIPEMINQLP